MAIKARLNELLKKYKWNELHDEQITPLLHRRVIWGENQNVALFLFKRGCHVRAHRHISEQVTQVLKGSLRLIVAGEEIVLDAGEALVIPPDTLHEAFADEDAEVMDSFSPKRDDWLRNEIDYLKK